MSEKGVSIWRFTARKIMFMVPTLLIVVTLVFTLIHLAPGDPVLIFVGEIGVTPAYVESLREKYGLTQPLYIQYFTYIRLLLKGDLGFSIYFGKPVAALILEVLPASLTLVLGSTLFSTVAGILLGLSAARDPYSKKDSAISLSSLIGYAMPIFWTGQILLLIFSLYLNLLPHGGMVDPRQEFTGLAYVTDVIIHLIAPAFTLGLYQAALVAQMTRTGVLEALGKNFIITARAKGLSERAVLLKHALRDAMVVVITVIGWNIGRIVAGAVLTETTFSWPGLGRLLWQAVGIRDYPLVIGIFIFIAASVMIINFVVDVAYAVIDPRIRYK